MPDWMTLPMLQAEMTQRREEGCYVDDLEARVAARGAQASADELLSFWAEAEGRTPTPYFPYREPSDLESIRCERPAGPRQLELALGRDELKDKVLGAWLGRAAGSSPGKAGRRLAPDPHPEGPRARRRVPARRLLPVPGESAGRRELPRRALATGSAARSTTWSATTTWTIRSSV